MRLVLIAAVTLFVTLPAHAKRPVFEVDANVINTPDVVVTNSPNAPVPVEVQNFPQAPSPAAEEFFVSTETIGLSQGEDFSSRELFTVPSDRTLIVEYISAFNATITAANGQEVQFDISYDNPNDFGFAIAPIVFSTSSDVNDAAGQRIFWPVPAGTAVNGSIKRNVDSFQSTYRITVTGRLIPTP
jgi:hypothetical protein